MGLLYIVKTATSVATTNIDFGLGGESFRFFQELSYALGLSVGSRRRIQPNPAAGDVRSKEYRHGPWMQLTNRQIEAENLKGECVIFEKRVFDLAKQAVASLHGETCCAARHSVDFNRTQFGIS